jgi:hypothetical protein
MTMAKKEKIVVENNNSSGIGFYGVLFITFLVLKLTGVIAWSWWWIFSPLWIPFVLVLGVLVGIGGVSLLIVVLELFRNIKKASS